MEIEEGKIVNITKGKAIIQMEAGSQCLTCGAKDACCVLSGGTTRQIEIPITNNIQNLQEGDKITMSFRPKTRILSAFLVFIFPILFLIAGYFGGFKLFGTEGKAILTGFAGLIFSFVLIWGLNKILIKDKNFLPKILAR